MKLLLTSGGVPAPAIRTALDDLLPRPVAECSALVVPSAQWGHPMCTPESAWRAVSGQPLGGPIAPMSDLGWGSLGLLELTALPHVDPARWQPWLDRADALLVDGGDALFLAHWLRASGLWDALAERPDLVWVGVSAGSMVLTPRVGPEFVQWRSADQDPDDDRTLGLVEFAIFPHLDHPDMPENTLAEAERWAAGLDVPAYALDERSALRVVDGEVEVVSDGQWHRFEPTVS
ncbi:Type 1 glutamine amidotransferase-like domain-containing protein [Nocardioides flavescens]|uniref:Peptidase E n=1 Tax=Nocardioides flavescens TaxID=2691959 RepID=A0A6L7ELF8_9ACTN|nr:peptidase E [Nocardioides flavescens]